MAIESSGPAGADYVGSVDLEQMTGTPASTWRYWAMNDAGPRSFKLGRRRVWRKTDVETWIAAQESVTATGGGTACQLKPNRDQPAQGGTA